MREAVREKFFDSTVKRKEALLSAIGIWKDRTDLPETSVYIRRLREDDRLKRFPKMTGVLLDSDVIIEVLRERSPDVVRKWINVVNTGKYRRAIVLFASRGSAWHARSGTRAN